MKYIIFLLFMPFLSGCTIKPIVDTRLPADATATAEARASLVPTVTPLPCIIKGNVSRDGERIYHVPGQLNYDRTVITIEQGEEWLCTEAEAIEKGYRKALR